MKKMMAQVLQISYLSVAVKLSAVFAVLFRLFYRPPSHGALQAIKSALLFLISAVVVLKGMVSRQF
jgi:hypothetical protein